MKEKIDISKIMDFKPKSNRVMLILVSWAISELLLSFLEYIFPVKFSFPTIIAVTIINVLMIPFIIKMYYLKKEDDEINCKIENLTNKEIYFLYECCTTRRYIYTGYDVSMPSITDFNLKWEGLLYVSAPENITTGAKYRILPVSHKIYQKVKKEKSHR